MELNNQAIIKKIKGLLAIANDKQDDAESQSAFLLAQKLMTKNNISMSEVDADTLPGQTIENGQVTAHKKLFWWERHLASIMAKNFRVKNYINSKFLKGKTQRKRAIVFLDFENDVHLAKEMYILAYEALLHNTERFVEAWYEESQAERLKSLTADIKKSYISGFLFGLEQKFEEQVKDMRQEHGLIVLVPQEVEQRYEEVVTGKAVPLTFPSIEKLTAFQVGYKDGNQIDYTRRTVAEPELNSYTSG